MVMEWGDINYFVKSFVGGFEILVGIYLWWVLVVVIVFLGFNNYFKKFYNNWCIIWYLDIKKKFCLGIVM